MTIATSSVIASADQLKIHDANGYLRLSARVALSLNVVTKALAVPTQNFNTVTLSAGTSGTCDTITGTGLTEGFVLVLLPTTSSDIITFTDTLVPASGSLSLAGSFTMTGLDCTLTLIYNGTNWIELSRTPGITMAKALAAAMIFA